MQFTNTPLFGGAITVDLPSTFGDTSTIREVPDHQEVYLDQHGYTSVVIEILEYVDQPSDDAALQYHFADLVDGTDDSSAILQQEKVQFDDAQLNSKPSLSLTFTQTPTTNLHRKHPEFVYIHLFLLRLKEHGTDVLVSVNVPHYKGEYEEPEGGEETELVREGEEVARRVLGTMRVREWGLFEG